MDGLTKARRLIVPANNPCSERASGSYTDLPPKHPRVRVANGRTALQGTIFSSLMLLAKHLCAQRMHCTLGCAGQAKIPEQVFYRRNDYWDCSFVSESTETAV